MKSSKKFAKLISVILLVSMLLTSNSVGVWADGLEWEEPESQTDLQENPYEEQAAENTEWESIGELASEETEFASEEAESASEEAESVSEEAESEPEEAESVSEEAESASEEAESDSEQDRQDAADNDGNENLEKDEQPDEDLPENLFPEDDVAEQEDESGEQPVDDPEDEEQTEDKKAAPEQSVRTNYYAISPNGELQVWADFDNAEAVPDLAVLRVNEVTADSPYYNYAAYMEALGNRENTHLYDLAFLTAETDENGYETGRILECQPSAGSVRVTMAFPADALTESVQVTHLPLSAEVRAYVPTTADAVSITADLIHPEEVRDLYVDAAGGVLAFTVDSFSVFAVTVNEPIAEDEKTGDPADANPVEISADQVMVAAAAEALIRSAAEALGLENTDASQEVLPVPGLRQVKRAEAPLPSDEEKPHSTRSGVGVGSSRP